MYIYIAHSVTFYYNPDRIPGDLFDSESSQREVGVSINGGMVLPLASGIDREIKIIL